MWQREVESCAAPGPPIRAGLSPSRAIAVPRNRRNGGGLALQASPRGNSAVWNRGQEHTDWVRAGSGEGFSQRAYDPPDWFAADADDRADDVVAGWQCTDGHDA